MSVDYKLIGSRIKSVRRGAKMTQEELAEAMSVTVGYVSQLERGVTKISLDTLAHIAEILDCDMPYFLTGTAGDHSTYLKDELYDAINGLDGRQRRFVMELIELVKKNT